MRHYSHSQKKNLSRCLDYQPFARFKHYSSLNHHLLTTRTNQHSLKGKFSHHARPQNCFAAVSAFIADCIKQSSLPSRGPAIAVLVLIFTPRRQPTTQTDGRVPIISEMRDPLPHGRLELGPSPSDDCFSFRIRRKTIREWAISQSCVFALSGSCQSTQKINSHRPEFISAAWPHLGHVWGTVYFLKLCA